LLDPYLSDSLTNKYKDTTKPHVRMSELVIEPKLLDCIDIVTSSHNHTDHLDAETLKPLLKVNPAIAFVIPEANRGFVAHRVNCNLTFPLGLTDGEKMEVKGFTFYGVPAAHNTVERDESGRCKFMGYVIQFGKWSVYHSGDTLWYDGMVETLKPFLLDVALLPINGNDPQRGVAGNLSASEAAELGKLVGARLVIPHHYDMFMFNTAEPGEFGTEAEVLHQPFRILKLGEHFVFP
jgi:L-ascorbate metabolism protein UlaG (beta-lactamase superfamily)